MTSNKFNQALPFLSWGKRVTRETLAHDAMAGLTGAIIALPQAMAYAFIAGLPPEYGLYSAIVVAIIAALFGSSKHMVTGPAAAISIVVMSVVSGVGPMPPEAYLSTALTLTLMVGLIQLGFGFLRLGSLVNFISHTVVIGFTSGAAVLIAASQFKHAFGVSVTDDGSLIGSLVALSAKWDSVNLYSLAIAVVTIVSSLIVRRINRRYPHLLVGMVAGSVTAYLLNAKEQGVAMVGALSGSLPPFSLPDLSLGTIQSLSSGAFALALLGLIEAISIARAIALRSHQQIDGNQEFIGQGLANTIGSFFSCFAGSGSFTRSGANYDAGAKTPLSVVFSACLQAAVLLFVPSVTAFLPLPAMAGSVLLIAWNLFDLAHIKHIIHSSKNETIILAVTFFATLFVELEFAIYIGVFLSLGIYLRRTSRPTMMEVAPIPTHPRRRIRNVSRYQLEECPQLKMLRVDGSLFFGATDHVQQHIRHYSESENGIFNVLLIGKGINFIDVAGAEMLIHEARRLEKLGGRLLVCSLKGTVTDELSKSGFLDKLGDHVLYESPEEALASLVPNLDQNICSTCPKRIFHECPTH